MRFLVTRPADEAERTAASLRALGHEALIAPVLRIEAINDAQIGDGPWSAVLMTSGNAARALAEHPQRLALVGLPTFAVGAQTTKAARDAGFADVVSADGDGADLARLVMARLRARTAPLLYLAGSDRARDLAGDLLQAGLPVETVVVYRAVAARELPADAAEAVRAGAIDGVLHYSRRSASIFADCVKASGLVEAVRPLAHCCLSQRAAEPLREIGLSDIRVAARPDEVALLALISKK